MSHSFIAYIDESGDEGFGKYRVKGRSGGASHWLTLSVSVWRFSRDHDAVKWVKEIKGSLPSQRVNKPLHFKDLDHAQKVMALNVLSEKPLRSICVTAHKSSMSEKTYGEKNRLYFYLCRYLIERLTWLCKDLRRVVPEGDGRVKIVFSRRGGMSYEKFQNYMKLLRDGHDNENIQIKWSVIDIDAIEARDHSSRAGLQIADLIASGFTAGLEPDMYGNCELRYASILRNQFYSKNGNFLSYGAKLVPNYKELKLNTQQSKFIEMFSR